MRSIKKAIPVSYPGTGKTLENGFNNPPYLLKHMQRADGCIKRSLTDNSDIRRPEPADPANMRV